MRHAYSVPLSLFAQFLFLNLLGGGPHLFRVPFLYMSHGFSGRLNTTSHTIGARGRGGGDHDFQLRVGIACAVFFFFRKEQGLMWTRICNFPRSMKSPGVIWGAELDCLGAW